MQSTQYVVQCTLFRSAFSGECGFEVQQADGRVYAGVAPLHYCHLQRGENVQEDTLPLEDSIAGLLNVQILGNGGETARVRLPDGDAITVLTGNLSRLVTETRSTHVLIGPGH